MRRFLAVLALAGAVFLVSAPVSVAGPHGCYKSKGCH
jgi:hypothetical protein